MGAEKPNILFILNDHQAYYRHGWDGGLGPARPHFERLASEGATFERAYTSSPLCTPARRSLATGLLPHNHGLLTLKENMPTRDHGLLWPLMRELGYRCYYYGKWHTGRGTALECGCEGFSPPGYNNPYVRPEYEEYLKERGLPHATFDVKHVFWEGRDPGTRPGPAHRLTWKSCTEHITGTLETPADTHECFFVANLAVEKLHEIASREDREPFFMSVHFWGPHMPYLASPEYVEMYAPADIQEYGSFGDRLEGKPSVYRTEFNAPVSEGGKLIVPNPMPWSTWREVLAYCYAQTTMVDAAGGRVLEELERLGLADDTLVIWTTDHGDAVASHGGHFDKNAYLSEEVVRIPMAMRLPERSAAGERRQELVSLIDLPCTILDAAGGAFTGPVDGESLLPLVAGPVRDRAGADRWRTDLMVETHGHHGEKVAGRSLVTERFKYSVYRYADAPHAEDELYDLQEDPYELKNLVRDPARRDLADDLRRRLKAWRERAADDAVVID